MNLIIQATIFLFTLLSCKYIDSPYMANIADLKLNRLNLEKILDNESSTNDQYKIAILSDTHNYYDQLNKAINVINKGNYAFVIIAGDITNIGLQSEFEKSHKIFSELNAPFLVIPGNHDLVASGAIIFERLYGLADQSFVFKNVRFILYNNNNWESQGEIPNISWLENELIESLEATKILISHVSPDDSDRFTANEIETLKNLVNNNQVTAYFNGHNHNPVMGKFGETDHITIGAPSKNVYVELEFSPLGVEYRHIFY